MNTLVIDASIAVKWVVEEDGTTDALALRQKAKLDRARIAGRRVREYLLEESYPTQTNLCTMKRFSPPRLLQGAEIELLPMRSLLESATQISIRD